MKWASNQTFVPGFGQRIHFRLAISLFEKLEVHLVSRSHFLSEQRSLKKNLKLCKIEVKRRKHFLLITLLLSNCCGKFHCFQENETSSADKNKTQTKSFNDVKVNAETQNLTGELEESYIANFILGGRRKSIDSWNFSQKTWNQI